MPTSLELSGSTDDDDIIFLLKRILPELDARIGYLKTAPKNNTDAITRVESLRGDVLDMIAYHTVIPYLPVV